MRTTLANLRTITSISWWPNLRSGFFGWAIFRLLKRWRLFGRLFLVPKKEGTYRSVIDLCQLFKFVENIYYDTENIYCLKTLLRRGGGGGGGLYDMHRPKGYLHVCLRSRTLVLTKDTKVLVFPMEKQMLCLPRSAIWDKIQLPDRVFAKLLKLIPAYLRRKGIRKIDD